jgi:hypothetical protein
LPNPHHAAHGMRGVMCRTGSCRAHAHESDVSQQCCLSLAIEFRMILNASTALCAAHQASGSARCVCNARQMPLSKAGTARPTILVWHRSCGVPGEETVVAPMSVTCTPHDPVLHMSIIGCRLPYRYIYGPTLLYKGNAADGRQGYDCTPISGVVLGEALTSAP